MIADEMEFRRSQDRQVGTAGLIRYMSNLRCQRPDRCKGHFGLYQCIGKLFWVVRRRSGMNVSCLGTECIRRTADDAFQLAIANSYDLSIQFVAHHQPIQTLRAREEPATSSLESLQDNMQ